MNEFDIDVEGLSVGRIILNILLIDHFGKVLSCREFCDLTLMDEEQYKRLVGKKRKGGFSEANVLLRVSFGLGFSYEEALILFWYNGIPAQSRAYDPLNKILFRLDDIVNWSAEKRLDELERCCEEYGYKLRERKMTKGIRR
ncbi:hypothetical protein [Butyrivibrio sp. ob235]|uniref:hypothetical protein n=1 Tax=Butyrivibrio sp. ob235 TaxID=1761780 RepID=UPI0011141F1C|nr:hypothetical protein [Butyrivibrio sp. ob235]